MKDIEGLMKALEPMLRAAQAQIKTKIDQPGMVSIPGAKMDQFLESLSDIDDRDAMAMLTLGLSLVYRGGLEGRMTIVEFCDNAIANVKNFIDNPPPGFASVPATPKKDDCDCPACRLRRKIEALQAKSEGDMTFDKEGSIIVASAEK